MKSITGMKSRFPNKEMVNITLTMYSTCDHRIYQCNVYREIVINKTKNISSLACFDIIAYKAQNSSNCAPDFRLKINFFFLGTICFFYKKMSKKCIVLDYFDIVIQLICKHDSPK